MKQPPAFQLYAADFFMDTLSWTTDEIGTYFLLLLTEWVNGPLPNNERVLAQNVRQDVRKFRKIWGNIREKFDINDAGLLENCRLETQRKEQLERRQRLVNAGRKGGLVKSGKDVEKQSDAKAIDANEALKPSSSSSTSKEKKDLKDTAQKEAAQMFDEFWSIYPKKRNKKKSQNIWKRLVKTKEVAIQIIEAVRNQRRLKMLDPRDDYKFCPYPSTWLHQERWNDSSCEVLTCDRCGKEQTLYHDDPNDCACGGKLK